MNAIAPRHWLLASPRCGVMQFEMLPYVASGQKCWMSAWHSAKTQAAFDNLDEQPTESSLMCAWIHSRMCPSPGAIPAHIDLRSTVQSRSSALTDAVEAVSVSVMPSAIA